MQLRNNNISNVRDTETVLLHLAMHSNDINLRELKCLPVLLRYIRHICHTKSIKGDILRDPVC